MERRKHFREYLSQQTIDEEAVPLLPIVELAGEHRMLIENHRGVSQYSCEKICVKVKYGLICICGHSLKLEYMTKVRLVILGQIDTVSLIRR